MYLLYLSEYAIEMSLLGLALMLSGILIPNRNAYWAAIYRSIARLLFSLGITLAITHKTPLILLIGVLGKFQDFANILAFLMLVSAIWSFLPIINHTEPDIETEHPEEDQQIYPDLSKAQEYIEVLERNNFIVKHTGGEQWSAINTDRTIVINFYSIEDLADYAKKYMHS